MVGLYAMRLAGSVPMASLYARYVKLLYRHESTFFVLDFSTKDDIKSYTVKISTVHSCNCPEKQSPYSNPRDNSYVCGHIYFVLISLLGVVRIDEMPLLPSKVRDILSRPMRPEAFAPDEIRRMFYERMFNVEETKNKVEVEDGALCPICLNAMMRSSKEEELVACRTCGNAVHEECFTKWKESKENKEPTTTCVMCRAPWEDHEVTLTLKSPP